MGIFGFPYFSFAIDKGFTYYREVLMAKDFKILTQEEVIDRALMAAEKGIDFVSLKPVGELEEPVQVEGEPLKGVDWAQYHSNIEALVMTRFKPQAPPVTKKKK
jgi:hypothetical protein